MGRPETQPSIAPAPAPASAPSSGIPWLYFATGAAAAALALVTFLKLRRRPEEAEVVEKPIAAQPAAEPQPDPLFARASKRTEAAPAPAAAAPEVVSIQLRPWIELEFKPARAAATNTEANVQFELTIVNKGNAPAQNIRIGSRMINAGPGQESEIETFYAEPFPEDAPAAVPHLPPNTGVKLNSFVALPKEQVREIEIQGRRLFIPTVAFNVLYEWGNGKRGQTSNAYLVGREAETPSPKMGGFRLDLGPRLYRSVGQRPTSLARAV